MSRWGAGEATVSGVINDSFSRHIETRSTDVRLENIFHAWLLAAVVLRCQARYQNCSRDDRFSNGAARQSIVAYTTGPVAATIDFRTARQSHVCSRGILSQRRVFRRLLHDARKSLHGSPRLIVGQCLHVGF